MFDFIQLFASPDGVYETAYAGGLNTNKTTDSALSAENKVFYTRNLLENASPNLVYNQLGQKASIPLNGGKTIEWRRYSGLAKALTPLNEGITPDGTKLTVTALQETLKQYGAYATLSDILEMTAIDNNIVVATDLLGDQAGRTIDTLTRDIVAGGTNVMYAPKIVSGAETAVTTRANLDGTAVLTVKMIEKAVAKLRKHNAKTVDGTYYVGVIHPYAAFQLMQDDKWTDAAKYGAPDQLFKGEIGRIGGVRFLQSSEAKIWNDSTTASNTAVYGTIIFAANAFGVVDLAGKGIETIVKQRGSAGSADPLDQRSTVGWKAMHAAKRLTEEFMVRIEHCVADAEFVNADAN